MTAKQFMEGSYDKKREKVEKFLYNFDPVDFEMECLMSREMTESEWEMEQEGHFDD